MKTAILITCHQRETLLKKTLLALKTLNPDRGIHIFLQPDNCQDHSTETAKTIWGDQITILEDTNKDRFWAQSMAAAEAAAITSEPDYIVWINEDTLTTSPLEGLLQPHQITVGSLNDQTGTPFRGGLLQCRRNPVRFDLAPPQCRCETFHGNLVAIPKPIYKRFRIPPSQHAFSDIAYGLAASKEGIPIRSSHPMGTTPQREGEWFHQPRGTQRLKACFHPKGLPPKDWWKFCSQNITNPVERTIRFLAPYRYLLLNKTK